MPEIPVVAYPWLKALHVFSVIVWMGAQFLLPALLTAHRGLPASSARATLLIDIERRLIHRVMNPAMLATFLFGALLAGAVIGAVSHIPSWLAFKLVLVFILAALHGKLLRQFWRARNGDKQWPAWSYRLAQGLHLLLLAGVVILVVARPLP
jgi:protoporphyrinogen IX oxidase